MYLRVSTDRQAQDDRFGLARQEATAREYAGRMNLEVAEVYADAITGRTETRENLARLIADAGRYNLVIASETDRLSRKAEAGYAIVRELTRAGLEVHTAARGRIDLDDPRSKFDFGVDLIFAERDLHYIKERLRDARHESARNGNIPFRWEPYGYRATYRLVGDERVREIVIDEPRAAVVRRIFALSAAGNPPNVIANFLNREGVPQPNGVRGWSSSTVTRFVRNERYKGRVVIQFKGAKPNVIEDEGLRIVDDETWQLAQAGLPRQPKPKADTTDRFPLHGLIRCAECGYSISGIPKTVGNGNYYDYYRCNGAAKKRCGHVTHWRSTKLHEAAASVLAEIASSPEAFVEHVQGPNAAARGRAEKERGRLQGVLEKYERMLENGSLDEGDYPRLKRRAREELAKVEEELAALEGGTAVDASGALEAIRAAILSGVPMREVLRESGTRFELSGSGRLEVRLLV